MSDTPLVKKYIDSVDGMAHQSAIEIIINLEKKLKTAGTYEDGYENGYQAGMAEKKEWVGLTHKDIEECLKMADHNLIKNPTHLYWGSLVKIIEVKLREKNDG